MIRKREGIMGNNRMNYSTEFDLYIDLFKVCNFCAKTIFIEKKKRRLPREDSKKWRGMKTNNNENWKKLWNMKVTIIPIVIGAFGTVTKGLLKGLEDLEVGGRVETIQTTVLLKTARILRRVLETWGDLLSLNFQWKTNSLRWWEKL